MSDTA